METALVLDSKKPQLAFRIKKRFEHRSDVQLKVKGILNTVDAQSRFDAALTKFLRIGKEPTYSPGDPFQPDTRLRLGLGARVAGVSGSAPSSDDAQLRISAKKKVVLSKQQDVVRGRVLLRNYTQAVLGGHYDYDLRREEWAGQLQASLSHAAFRFTEDQDVRLTVGVRAPVSERGVGTAEPYLRLQENCWAVTINRSSAGAVSWVASYDL